MQTFEQTLASSTIGHQTEDTRSLDDMVLPAARETEDLESHNEAVHGSAQSEAGVETLSSRIRSEVDGTANSVRVRATRTRAKRAEVSGRPITCDIDPRQCPLGQIVQEDGIPGSLDFRCLLFNPQDITTVSACNYLFANADNCYVTGPGEFGMDICREPICLTRCD